MSMMAVRARVYGKVQGVFFRKSTLEKAEALDIHGWVRNEADGTVSVHMQGNEQNVNALSSWLYKGSKWSRVEHVDLEKTELIETNRFYIER